MLSDQVIAHYRNFKQIVPGKAEEKQIFKEFEQNSGYNSYQVIKEATTQNKPTHIQQKTTQEHRGPNTEAFKTKANEQRKLGWGPNRGFQNESQRTTRVGVGPNKRNATSIYGQSKLGWPQLGEVRSETQQAKQAEIILRILLCIIFFHS